MNEREQAIASQLLSRWRRLGAELLISNLTCDDAGELASLSAQILDLTDETGTFLNLDQPAVAAAGAE